MLYLSFPVVLVDLCSLMICCFSFPIMQPLHKLTSLHSLTRPSSLALTPPPHSPVHSLGHSLSTHRRSSSLLRSSTHLLSSVICSRPRSLAYSLFQLLLAPSHTCNQSFNQPSSQSVNHSGSQTPSVAAAPSAAAIIHAAPRRAGLSDGLVQC